MIIDQIDNWDKHFCDDAWRMVFEFLSSVDEDVATGRHELLGDDVFANVMNYQTMSPSEQIIEAHEKYLDVQVVLTGREMIHVYPATQLAVDKPFDKMQDVVFYKHNGLVPHQIELTPGTFAVFYPENAHSPGLIYDQQSESVKKVVVKVSCALMG